MAQVGQLANVAMQTGAARFGLWLFVVAVQGCSAAGGATLKITHPDEQTLGAGAAYLLKDIYPGTQATDLGSAPGEITEVGGLAMFVANEPGTGLELWKSDGTNGEELWWSDGTADGTVLLKVIYTGRKMPGGVRPAKMSSRSVR